MAENPEVKVTLTAEDQGLSAALRQLSQELKNVKTQQDQTASSSMKLGDAFKYLLEAISIDRIVEFGKEILDTAVQVGNLARTIGVSSSTISVFRHVSEQTGASWERISRSLAMGARRIVEFEGGQQQATEGMKLLGLTTQDFIGLNPDQKLELMVKALGRMPDGFNKAAAAQMLFSRGGREMVVVANALARQGFSQIEDELRRLGVLMDDDFTNKAAIAQASMHELHDAAEGFAVQLESGLLPAISDVGEALVKSSGGAASFEKIGEYVGDVVKFFVEGAMAIGAVLGDVIAAGVDGFEFLWHEVESGGKKAIGTIAAASMALVGNFRGAWETLKLVDTAGATDEANRIKAIFAGLKDQLVGIDKDLFPSAEEEARRNRERIKQLGLDQARGDSDVPYLGAFTKKGAPEGAAKAELALALKLQQDLLDVWKAGAAERAEAEKEAYEKGTLDLKAYFADRRAALEEETAKEVEVLKAERDQVQAAAAAASGRASAAQAAIGTRRPAAAGSPGGDRAGR